MALYFSKKEQKSLDSEQTTSEDQYELAIEYIEASKNHNKLWNPKYGKAHLLLRLSAQRGNKKAKDSLIKMEEDFLSNKFDGKFQYFTMYRKYRDGYPEFGIDPDPAKALIFAKSAIDKDKSIKKECLLSLRSHLIIGDKISDAILEESWDFIIDVLKSKKEKVSNKVQSGLDRFTKRYGAKQENPNNRNTTIRVLKTPAPLNNIQSAPGIGIFIRQPEIEIAIRKIIIRSEQEQCIPQ